MKCTIFYQTELVKCVKIPLSKSNCGLNIFQPPVSMTGYHSSSKLFCLYCLVSKECTTILWALRGRHKNLCVFFFSVKGLVGPPRDMLAQCIESGIVPSYRNKTFCFANKKKKKIRIHAAFGMFAMLWLCLAREVSIITFTPDDFSPTVACIGPLVLGKLAIREEGLRFRSRSGFKSSAWFLSVLQPKYIQEHDLGILAPL